MALENAPPPGLALPVSKVERVESELQKLSPAELRQVRDWLDDFLEDQMEFTPEFEAAIRESERELQRHRQRWSIRRMQQSTRLVGEMVALPGSRDARR